MHFKILEIHFLEKKSGKNPAKFFETGRELEPDIEAGTGFSRISGRFLEKNIIFIFTVCYFY